MAEIERDCRKEQIDLPQDDGSELEHRGHGALDGKSLAEALEDLKERVPDVMAQNPGISRASAERYLAIIITEVNAALREGKSIPFIKSDSRSKTGYSLDFLIASKILGKIASQKPER